MAISAPSILTNPFAYNGDYTIPPAAGLDTDDTVSQEVGFPQTQSTPLGEDGVPVNRSQTNGIFYLYSKTIVWLNAGGTFTFSNSIVTDQGGYNLGAILWCQATKNYQRSLINNNTANFVTNNNYINDGVNWETVTPTLKTVKFVDVGSDNWVVPIGVYKIFVTLVGGGGGGGGGLLINDTTSISGTGGASGSAIIKEEIDVSPGDVVYYSIGGGGTGGTGGSTPTTGGIGNGSSVQVNLITLNTQGGYGGSQGVVADFQYRPGAESNGPYSIAGTGSSSYLPGSGGSSILSPGVVGQLKATQDNAYLGAGGAGGSNSSTTAGNGGNGGDGALIIEYFS